MFLTLFLNNVQSYWFVFIVLTVLISCATSISNYIRISYYITKFPGPLAYPIVGNSPLLFGSTEKFTHNLLDVGIITCWINPLFRLWFGPVPVVFVSDPEIVQILLTNENTVEKSYIFKKTWDAVMGEDLLTSTVSKWKRNRAIIMKGFSSSILKSFFYTFIEKINTLTQKLDLELNKEKSFDVFEYLSNTTLDTVCATAMGVEMSTQEDEFNYYNAVHKATVLGAKKIFNPLMYPDIFYKLTKNFIETWKCRDVIFGFTDKVISNKRQQYRTNGNYISNDSKSIIRNEFKKPLLEYLMDFKETNSNFTDEQLRNEINLIIAAAYETTATVLSYTLLYLAGYKDIQSKVYDELWEVFGDTNDNSMSFSDLSSLKYMDMVIMESMRLAPAIPIIGREVTKDIKIGKYVFPKGIDVVISLFTLHRNNYHWENPSKFDPERFTQENKKKQHPYSYIPFSGGPRNCIGIRYAQIFMKTALAILLRRYEFHTYLDLHNLRYEFAVSLQLVGGYQVKITPRQKHC